MKPRVRVGFAGARWLGARVLEHIATDPRVEMSTWYYRAKGWWGDEPCPLHTNTFDGPAPDIIVSCLTDRIWTPNEITDTPLGIINLHPAPLPAYRGCNSYAHAIINGDTQYAVTLHYVDETIDTGPVIARDWLSIEPTDTGRRLYERAQAAALNMFTREWEHIVEAGLRGQVARAREQSMLGEAGYYRRDSLDEYRVIRRDWPREHQNRVRRAMTFPPHPAPVEENAYAGWPL